MLRKLVADWRLTAPIALHGDYYPISPYSLDEDRWIAWQFDRSETGEGYLEAFRHSASDYEMARYKLKGLVAEATYTVRNLDSNEEIAITGKQMMEEGVPVKIAERPGSAIMFYRKK
jgi:alpha-galactosidase